MVGCRGEFVLPPHLSWIDAVSCNAHGATSRRHGGGTTDDPPWRWAVLPSREPRGPQCRRVTMVVLAVSVGASGGALPVFVRRPEAVSLVPISAIGNLATHQSAVDGGNGRREVVTTAVFAEVAAICA